MPDGNEYKPPHVVIVDRDIAILNALTFALEMAGFTAESYPDGAALPPHCDWPVRTCLIVSYELGGTNGLELLKVLRRRKVTAPAVLIITNPTRRHRAAAVADGITIVEKPLLNEDLEKAVRHALEPSGSHRPGRAGRPRPSIGHVFRPLADQTAPESPSRPQDQSMSRRSLA